MVVILFAAAVTVFILLEVMVERMEKVKTREKAKELVQT